MAKPPRTDSPLDIPALAGGTPPTTQELIYQRLRNAIVVGAIAPGTALTMRGLAETLQVSPTPIREAMRRLSSENAVLEKTNRRFEIPLMELGRFQDLIETRIVLETHAAHRAMPHISAVIVEELTRIDNAMDASIDQDNYDTLTSLNLQFHRCLYRANPNHAVLPLIESTWLQLGPFQRQALTSLRDFYLVDRHKEILDALEHRDDAALSAAIISDIQDGIGAAGRAALTETETVKTEAACNFS